MPADTDVDKDETKTQTENNGSAGTNKPPVVENSPDSSADPLLGYSDVARMFNKHFSTIKRWHQDGLLAFRRMPGGRYAIRRSEVLRFIGGTALGK